MKTSELYNIIKENEDTLRKYPLIRMYMLVYNNILANRGAKKSIQALSNILVDLYKNPPPELLQLITPMNVITPMGIDITIDNPLPIPEGMLVNQANNLSVVSAPVTAELKALIDSAVEDIQSSFRNCTNEEYQERRAICNGCEFFDRHASLGEGKCLKWCSCAGRFQLTRGSLTCPTGKWGPVV